MRILVWGMGYVGTVTAACLAQLGNEVVGVEPNLTKVRSVNSGHSPVREPGLDELVRRMVEERRLKAQQDCADLVPWADLSLICVGTPSAPDGSTVLDHVRDAAVSIGRGLQGSNGYHVVVMRSTVFPGTARRLLRPILEAHSSRRAGKDFGMAVNPEFLRETTAIDDFKAPPYTVIGELDHRSGDILESLYRDIEADVYHATLEEAEMLKLASNAFHALKISFANEIGRLCDGVSINGQSVMQLVRDDTKLNISPAYLRPGFAFGGSCLPKDLRALLFNAQQLAVELPVLEAILPSNRLQIDAALQEIHSLGGQRIAILGLSFKPGTDDLRESPVLDLVRVLCQDGFEVQVFDPDVRLDALMGSNKESIEGILPEIGQVLCSSLEHALQDCDTLVVTQDRREFAAAAQSLDGRVGLIDFVGLPALPQLDQVTYLQEIQTQQVQ
ncbi:MAG: UDP-glucose dehydrogenase family protein [Anaerolineales bacterium]